MMKLWVTLLLAGLVCSLAAGGESGMSQRECGVTLGWSPMGCRRRIQAFQMCAKGLGAEWGVSCVRWGGPDTPPRWVMPSLFLLQFLLMRCLLEAPVS